MHDEAVGDGVTDIPEGLAVAVGQQDPLFVQLARAIATDITRGAFRSRLPPERVLCERFGVSRMTVRRALETVASQGLIVPSWGRGWYVAEGPLSEPPNLLLSFSDLARRRGLTPASRLLSLESAHASLEAAETLGIAPGAPVILFERLRLADQVPTVLQNSIIPVTRIPGIEVDALADLGDRSLYSLLEESYAVSPVRGDYVVEARPADTRTADLLEIDAGSPVLWTTQTTYDELGQAIQLEWSAYPHDRYRFRATLTRSPRRRRPTDRPAR